LRVIYVPDSEPGGVFVITAYDLVGKPLAAFRRPAGKSTMSRNQFPVGWDEEKVRRVLAYHEEQTEEDALVEDEAGMAL
jgi:CBS domain-containing protein